MTTEDMIIISVGDHIVDLDGAAGTRHVSNLVDVDPDQVSTGMKVKVDFNTIQDDWKLPICRPV